MKGLEWRGKPTYPSLLFKGNGVVQAALHQRRRVVSHSWQPGRMRDVRPVQPSAPRGGQLNGVQLNRLQSQVLGNLVPVNPCHGRHILHQEPETTNSFAFWLLRNYMKKTNHVTCFSVGFTIWGWNPWALSRDQRIACFEIREAYRMPVHNNINVKQEHY